MWKVRGYERSRITSLKIIFVLPRILGENQKSQLGAGPQDEIQPRDCESAPPSLLGEWFVFHLKSMQPIILTHIAPISNSKDPFNSLSIY